ACDSYVLPALTNGSYFDAPNGGGNMLSAGDAITTSQTVYVYAESGTTPNCTAENSFSVTITEQPDAGDNGAMAICTGTGAATDLFGALGGTPDNGGTWNDDDS
ncbi:hypothetical protein, partial [Muricauda brasiliensis]|uniref:hypothetical protein n=1 Tax=Muricauda brasiliensis TaxID=2162892 RepID=UPI00131ED233